MKAKSQRLKEIYGILYTEANKQVKRLARTYKRLCVDSLAIELDSKKEEDHIFTPLNNINQGSEWTREMCINCVDFKKTYDDIHRDSESLDNTTYIWNPDTYCGPHQV